jgi:hypothetical protein
MLGCGSLESEIVKHGHESRGTRTSELLRWRGPGVIVNDRHILSSEKMLHNDYNALKTRMMVGTFNNKIFFINVCTLFLDITPLLT